MATGIKWFFEGYVKTFLQYLAAGIATIPFGVVYAWISISHPGVRWGLLAPFGCGLFSAFLAWQIAGSVMDRRTALRIAGQSSVLVSGPAMKSGPDPTFPIAPRHRS